MRMARNELQQHMSKETSTRINHKHLLRKLKGEVQDQTGENKKKQRRSTDTKNSKRNTHDSLIAAALSISREKSFFSISMREITREIGKSPASFYNHFESMENLAIHIIDDTLGRHQESLKQARAPGAPLGDQGYRVIESVLAIFNERPDHYRFTIGLFDCREPMIRAAIDRHWRRMLTELREDLKHFSFFENLDKDTFELTTKLLAKTCLRQAAEITKIDTSKVEQKELLSDSAIELRMICLGAAHWRPNSERLETAKAP